MEPNHDSEWLHKQAELEDGADCSVGSLPSIDLDEELKDRDQRPAVNGGAEDENQQVPMTKEEFVENAMELLTPPKEEKFPELTADQKQLMKNRVKRMQKKIAKIGKLYTATKVGEIIQMNDRHYIVQKDGSFRFVRML